jgi:hypothetical protein
MTLLRSEDAFDFSAARTRQFLRAVWGALSGDKPELLSWDEVRDKLQLRGLIGHGVVTVPIDQIVGSVGRYEDFDDAFLPKSNALSARWRRVDRAFYDDISLPPVTLYKVGDAYFVLDGNHRVSVARANGATFIDAEVLEARTRVPVSAKDLNADTLVILGEYARFLDRTRLDQLRPGQNIRFSIGGGYDRLIEHIAVHRYYMGIERGRPIDEDEAVADWHDRVYMPVVEAVREAGILKGFPGRTEADLYLWVIEHQHYLKEECGCDISPEEAAEDYGEQYSQRSPLQRVQAAVGQVVEALTKA